MKSIRSDPLGNKKYADRNTILSRLKKSSLQGNLIDLWLKKVISSSVPFNTLILDADDLNITPVQKIEIETIVQKLRNQDPLALITDGKCEGIDCTSTSRAQLQHVEDDESHADLYYKSSAQQKTLSFVGVIVSD
ncbi:unnamed protein product [Penicillium pancosmium]